MKTCSGCTRRSVLQGLGIATLGLAVLDACSNSGSSLPTATANACGSDMCIDLGDAANADLAQVGGAMLVDFRGDTVMVIRSSDTQAIALSAICTHAGCSMDFDAAQHQLTCPCHGSVFNEAGDVLVGPARRPLQVYTAVIANNAITVS